MNNNDIYDIFVICGGKCGGTTLSETFKQNGFKTLHLHSPNCLGLNSCKYDINLKNNNIYNIINKSASKKKIYIFDIYRTPIERKISSFFQNLDINVPNNKSLNLNELIDIFNNKYLKTLEEYHPIDIIMKYYDIKPFEHFNFEKKYTSLKKDNIIFIKLSLTYSNLFEKILTEIFNKSIKLYNKNISNNKDYKILYNNFIKSYKVPKYFKEQLINDKKFNIYNTKNQQQQYYEKWNLN